MNKNKEIEVEISNGDSKSCVMDVALELPATWSEFFDALQKARIADPRHCNNEILTMRHVQKCLRRPIGRNVNLLELNLLAQRMTMLTEEQMLGFEGLLQMELPAESGSVPLPKLINLTFCTDQCRVTANVRCDRELGMLLLDSDMLPAEAAHLFAATEPDSEYRNSLLEVFGKKHREDAGGVFIDQSYIETIGEIGSVYIPGQMAYFDRTGAPVVLKACRDRSDTSAGHLIVTLDLPASEKGISRALEAADAASGDERVFQCVDCLIPSVRPIIDNAIQTGGFEQVKEFAELLAAKERIWSEANLITYKAVLEACGCTDLEDATKLAEELSQYEILPEIAQTWDYAELILRERYPDIPAALFQTPQASQIGGQMLEQNDAALTSYGLVRRRDGQPLPEFRPEPGGITQEMV